MYCAAKDFAHFVRVDDENNEIVPKIENASLDISNASNRIDKDTLVDELNELIKTYERLPQRAMLEPVTHADFCSLLLLLSSILRT